MANTETIKKAVVKKTVKVAPKAVKEAVVKKKEMPMKAEPAKRTLTGTVVSTKMQKTVVVAIERKVAHKLYRKLIRVTKKLKADTNGLELSEGDIVKIQGTRPLSKDKNYKVVSKEEKR